MVDVHVTDPYTFMTTDMSDDSNIIDNLRIPVTEEENSRNQNKSHGSTQTIFYMYQTCKFGDVLRVLIFRYSLF